MTSVLGLDIGGANLKAATSDGQAVSIPFPLWKHPELLVSRLQSLEVRFKPQGVAVTMTGELCDCFTSKREGVQQIVSAVESAFAGRGLKFWSTVGRFVNSTEAKEHPREVAAANWHALASVVGSWVPRGLAVLVDIGSTTADLIPILEGRPHSQGMTDPDRLRAGELVYTGVKRTPLCAILGMECAAEFFATTEDVYTLLGDLGENAEQRETADGRPMTLEFVHARLARMLCDDTEHFSRKEAEDLARKVRGKQVSQLSQSLKRIQSRYSEPIQAVIQSGEGEFLLPSILQEAGLETVPRISIWEKWGQDNSRAACAYAVAQLFEMDCF